jgi:LPXTG-motif cell wall-anchored protein
MYRTQQYREVNRTFSPYMPPHPMRGLGTYALSGDTCDALKQQADFTALSANSLQTTYTAMVSARDNAASDDERAALQAQVDSLYANYQTQLQAASAANDAYLKCQSPSVSPQPYVDPGPDPVVPVNPVNPVGPTPVTPTLKCPAGQILSADGKSCVTPPKAAGGTNWTLILGGVALLGVGAFVLLRKKR